MKTRMKWPAGAALALGIGLGLIGAAQAQVVTTSSDSLTVTITPNAYYALQITTSAQGGVSSTGDFNLGSVNLGASTYTVHPATLTIQSTFATTDLQLTGQIVNNGGTAWTFDQSTATQEKDALAAWALFTDTGVAGAPATNQFGGTTPGAAGSGVIGGSAQNVGISGGAASLFEEAGGAPGRKVMTNLPGYAQDPGASKAYLWLGFRLPSATTSSTAQAITLVLVAVAPH